ncbi:MAG: hypothetical protein ACI4J7_14270 [Ruminiclostridium sp.]
MKKSKKDSSCSFEVIYNPYQADEKDTFSDIFFRYCNDKFGEIEIDGIMFYRALQIIKTNIRGRHHLTIALSTNMNLKIGMIIIDENSNEYEIKGFEMYRFSADFPDWFLKISFVMVTGNNENIGTYFSVKQS